MDYLICPGASKSGTTWLYGLLRQHPEIRVSDVRETKFFTYSQDMSKETFEDLFDGPQDDTKYYCDISPIYLIDQTVPQKIYETLGPDVKLVFLFRNPVDRMYSQYQMDKRFGFEKESLTDVLSRPEVSRQALSKGNFDHIYGNDYRGESLYTEALMRYREYFPTDNMHIMVFEELIDNPTKALTELFSFLGVEDCSDTLNYDTRKGEGRINTRNHFLMRFYLQRLERYRWIQGLTEFSITKRIARFVLGRKNKKYPGLDQETRKELSRTFQLSLEQLETLCGRSFEIWNV